MTIGKICWLLLSFFLYPMFVFGQDVEQSFNKYKTRLQNDPLRITGSFNAYGQFYAANNISERALPFSGRLLGALNFDFLGIKMPLSLVLSNGGVVFNKKLPSYNFIGISPSYKWAKILIGNRTMNFGKYSFNNHSFQGLGFELTPNNWNFSAFYGRLRRARIEDFIGFNNIDPYYRRMGFGMSTGYDSGKDRLMLSIFKAWDDDKGLDSLQANSYFSPSENVILSIEAIKEISSRILLEVNYSNSGFTENRTLANEEQRIKISNYAGLLKQNISSRSNNAFEAKINLNFKKIVFDIAYERIDPGYRTMGALFFNNDLENISSGLKLKFFKSKWVINSRIGIQQNNLNQNQSNDYARFVGSVRTNVNIIKNLSLTGVVSNFNNVNRRRSILNPNTPILFTELVLNNMDANLGLNYILTNDNSRSSSIQGSYSYSEGNTIENDLINVLQITQSKNAYLQYILQLKPSQWNFGALTSYQKNNFGINATSFMNLGLNANKKLLNEKLELGLSLNFAITNQKIDNNQTSNGQLYNVTWSIMWKTSETSALTLHSGFILNDVKNTNNTDSRFSESRTNLNFQYRFKPKK